MDKKYVIFDMDGTLLESMHYWRRLTRDYAEHAGFGWSDKIAEEIEPFTMRETAQYYIDHFDVDDTVDEIVEYCYDRMAQYYRENVELKPGVREYLDLLQARGVRMSLATATDRYLVEPVLKRLDLEKYFDATLCVNEVGISKQDPKIYDELRAEWGKDREDVAVFEDAPYAVKTAVNAGYYTIMCYDSSYGDEQFEYEDLPERFIRDMTELLEDCKERTA